MCFLFVSKPQHCMLSPHARPPLYVFSLRQQATTGLGRLGCGRGLYVFSLRQQATTDCLYSINIQCITGYKEGEIVAS